MNDKRIYTGDINIQIKEYENDGETVIFLHFGDGNLMMWQKVVPFFQDNYHLILVDLRGHGKSDKPAEGYHIDDTAHDVVMVMKELGIKKAHVVGSSLGAETGLSMAANYPSKILSLVLDGALFSNFGPYGLWEGTEDEFNAHAVQVLEKMRNAPKKLYPSVDALVKESREDFEKHGWWSDTFEAVKRYGAIKNEEGKYKSCWSDIAEEYTKNYFFYKLEDYYQKIKCPVLMLPDEIPGQDENEKRVMESLFKLLENGKIVNVPGLIHPFGWMLEPEGACNAVLDFLDDIREK